MQKKKISVRVTITVLTFSIILSSLLIGLYPKIDKTISALEVKSLVSQYGFYQELIYVNYGLYYQMIDEFTEEKYAPADVYLGENYILDDGYTKEAFNSYIRQGYVNLLDISSRIDYYVYNKDLQEGLTNIAQEDIKSMLELTFLDNRYDYYIMFKYDEKGTLVIEQFEPGIDDVIKKSFIEEDRQVRHMFSSDAVPINPIRNTIYFYGIQDLTAFSLAEEYYNDYDLIGVQYIIGLSIVAMVGFMLIPNKLLGAMKWLSALEKIPIEVLIWSIGALMLIQLNSMNYMIEEYMQGSFRVIFGIFLPDAIDNELIGTGIHLIVWIIYFTSILIIVRIIKNILNMGIKTAIAQNSILVWGCNGIKNISEKSISYISRMHLKQENLSIIVRFIGVNAFIFAGFCLLGAWGIIGVIAYSLILYYFVMRILKNIGRYYEKLLESTSSLAKGELNSEKVQEHLGMFEPIKKHIEVIQEEFRESVEEEVRAQKFKTDLITNVSHDLKTPLTSIISYIDLLKQTKISEDKRKEYIEVLDRKSSRLQTLIEDLFEMSKVNSGHIQINKEQVDVVALIKQTLFELEDKVEASGIVFRTQFPDYKVHLSLDGMRTFRVFDNLINNIAKYAMPNSRAYIEVVQNEEEVVIILKNTAKEELTFDTDYITERFVRGDESRNTEGSGLGLAIAKSFVELQGGVFEIKVDGDLFKVIIKFKL